MMIDDSNIPLVQVEGFKFQGTFHPTIAGFKFSTTQKMMASFLPSTEGVIFHCELQTCDGT